MKKYEFGKFDEDYGYQIISLVDIPSIEVRKGDEGGFIKHEYSLSHLGNCWVSEGATVSEFASVSGNAYIGKHVSVEDNAKVYGNAYILDCEEDSWGASRIMGNSQIYDNAIIDHVLTYDSINVYESANVSYSYLSGYSQIFGHADVSSVFSYDNSKIYGRAVVKGVMLFDNSQVYDKAYVYSIPSGTILNPGPVTKLHKNAKIYGTAKVRLNGSLSGTRNGGRLDILKKLFLE